jgi:hypothetical protein
MNIKRYAAVYQVDIKETVNGTVSLAVLPGVCTSLVLMLSLVLSLATVVCPLFLRLALPGNCQIEW